MSANRGREVAEAFAHSEFDYVRIDELDHPEEEWHNFTDFHVLWPWLHIKLSSSPKSPQRQNLFFTQKVFLAGGISGAISKTISSPFSRLTILQQTNVLDPTKPQLNSIQLSRQIWKTEGLNGFFVGNFADVVRGTLFADCDPTEGKGPTQFMSGGLAGVVSVMISNPLDVVRTRLTIQTKDSRTYSGIVDCIYKIISKEGTHALWTGSFISSIQVFPKMAINYSLYDYTKRLSQGHLTDHETLRRLLCASLAGVVSGTVTFPFDAVIRNMQVQSQPVTALAIARSIYKAQGALGFWRGFGPQLIKSLPTVATTLTVYDKMKVLLNLPEPSP